MESLWEWAHTYIMLLWYFGPCNLLYENPLTRNVGSLSMVVNPHPWRSLAQSQLPYFETPSPLTPPSPCLLPANKTFLYTKTTLTLPSSCIRHKYNRIEYLKVTFNKHVIPSPIVMFVTSIKLLLYICWCYCISLACHCGCLSSVFS